LKGGILTGREKYRDNLLKLRGFHTAAQRTQRKNQSIPLHALGCSKKAPG
jgi:hypothetical protein